MSARAERPHGRGALRTLGMVGAVALGGVAVFLVVVGHSQKQVQIGLLVGLWGVLLGAFTLFGPRRAALESELEGLARGADRAPVRRREDDAQLELTVRREMERVLRDELSQLRGEVAGLRNELVEKVGGSLVEKVSGQLRLERIETTRVISSDIDELQHEVRRLAVARGNAPPALDGATFSPATVVESRVKNSAPLPYVYANPHNRDRPAAARPTPAPSSPVPPPVVAPAQPAQPPARPAPPPARPAPSPSPLPVPQSGPQPVPSARPGSPTTAPPYAAAASPYASAASAGASPQPRPAPAVPAPATPPVPAPGAPSPGRPSPLTTPPVHEVSENTVPRGYPSPYPAAPSFPTAAYSAPAPFEPRTPEPAPLDAPRSPSFDPQRLSFEALRPAAPEPPRSQPLSEPTSFGAPTPFESRPLAPEPARSLASTPNPVPPPAKPVPPPTTPVYAPTPTPTPTPATADDPLDGLPRLSRFEYDVDEPGERRPPALVWDFDHVGPASRPPAAPPVEPPAPARPYVGRRRSAGEAGSAYPPDGSSGAANVGGAYDPPRGAPYAPRGAANGHGAYGGSNGAYSNGSNGTKGANGTSAYGGSNGVGGYSNGSNGTSAHTNGHGAYSGSNGAHGANGHGSANGAPSNGGGRRRRAEGEVDDVLARLLGR